MSKSDKQLPFQEVIGPKFETVEVFIDEALATFLDLQFGNRFSSTYRSEVMKAMESVKQQVPAFAPIQDIEFDSLLDAFDRILNTHMSRHYRSELFDEKVRLTKMRFCRHLYMPNADSLMAVFYYIPDYVLGAQSRVLSLQFETQQSKTYAPS